MKKLITLFAYLVIGIFILSIYYYQEVGSLLDTVSQSDEGLVFNIYVKYFKSADSWNLIWFFIFSLTFFMLMTWIDVRFLRFFIWLKNRYPNRKLFEILSGRWGRIVHIFSAISIVGLLAVTAANTIIIRYGNSHTVALHEVRDSSVVMLPGTNKYLRSFKTEKKENVYFKYRIEAARELWEAGKVKRFLVSGDKTGELGYDETNDMKKDLMAFGVPEEYIVLDTSGLRTHDSMVALRHLCAKIHTREAVVVSQAFQNRRSLFMAPFFGIVAQGYSAKGSPTWAMTTREFLGKPKVFIDLFITNVPPKETQAVDMRERFEITSGDHLYCIFCMFFAFMFFIMYMTKYLEKYEVVSLV